MAITMTELDNMPAQHPEAEAKNITCGSCQWFTAGFKGRHCQKLRGVDHNTLACEEYILPLDDPFVMVLQDKYIQGIRKELQSIRFKIDESVSEELKSSIVEDDNIVKGKFGSKQDLEGIAVVLRNVIALRSRVSTIYTSLIDIKFEFDEMQSHCSLWLYSKYAQLMKDLKNETMRKAAFLRIVPEMIQVQSNIEKNIILAKYADDRLDANERTLTKILGSSEKLYFSRERIGGIGKI